MTSTETIVLIVEDDPAVAELVKFSLREEHWRCYAVPTVTQAWEFIRQQMPDLVLLDWMLQNENGLHLLSRIRADRTLNRLPVILLTARTLDDDLALGLENGADDYVTKPFSPRDLGIRARTVLRRKTDERPAPLQLGPLTLDPRSCSVRIGSNQVDVPFAEYRLLKFLLCHPEQVFSRAELLEKVWHAHGALDDRTVDVHVLRLRKVLGSARELLKTVRGFGYMLSDS